MKKEAVLGADQLKLAEQILGISLTLGKAISSPFRKDSHPSFSVYYGRDGKFHWKDFAQDGGDIFSLAMEAWGVDFKVALDRLFGMVGGNDIVVPSAVLKSRQALKNMRVNNTVIKPVKREWDVRDTLFWGHRYGLTQEFLAKYGVYPLDHATVINDNGTYTVRSASLDGKNVLYGYNIGKHWKLYRPMHHEKKYRYGPSNTTRDDIFGFKQLIESPEKGPTLITAGQKDALCGIRHLKCNCVSFNAESLLPSEIHVICLLQNSKKIFILYDNDQTGHDWMQKITEAYPYIKPVKIDWPSECKDIADLVEKGHCNVLEKITQQLYK